MILEPLLLASLVFPGVLLRKSDDESRYEWLSKVLIVSVVLNGVAFSVLQRTGGFEPALLLSSLAIASVIASYRLFVELRRPSGVRTAAPVVIAIGLIALWGLYCALLFPPFQVDSLLYHLPISKFAIDPELDLFYSTTEHKVAWLYQGATGSNAIDRHRSLFLLFESRLSSLIPAMVSVAFLFSIVELCRFLRLSALWQFVGVALTVASPMLIDMIGGSKVDYYPTAAVTFALVSFGRYLQLADDESVPDLERRRTERGLLARMTLFIVIATFSKNTGLLAFALFPIAALAAGPTRARVRQLGVAAVLGISALTPHWIGFVDRPAYPDLGLDVSLAESLKTFATLGLRSLFLISNQYAGAVLAILIAAIAIRALGSRTRGWTKFEVAGLVLIGLWVAGVIAGIHKYQRPLQFRIMGHYLLPAYPLLLALGLESMRQVVGAWRAPAQPSSTLLRRSGVFALVLVGVISGSKMVPWHILEAKTIRRYGDLTFQPFASFEAKLEAIYGRVPEIWKEVNRRHREQPEGRLLTDDLKVLYYDCPVYGVLAVPVGYDERQIHDWVIENQIRWVLWYAELETELPLQSFEQSDASRDTQIIPFLESEVCVFIGEYDGRHLYEVRDLHEIPSAAAEEERASARRARVQKASFQH